MGYVIEELGTLPKEAGVRFFVYLIDGSFSNSTADFIKENFFEIARRMGREGAIVATTAPNDFYGELAEAYFGQPFESVINHLPALLITDARPEEVREDSLKLIVPLIEAEANFGTIEYFFDQLGKFVEGANPNFLDNFEERINLEADANDVVMLQPNFFGIGLNLNVAIDKYLRRNNT